jgi:hypothetical protein
MTAEMKRGTAATGRPTNGQQNISYCGGRNRSSARRQERIAERRAQIPRAYRANYDKAVAGRSLRAAIRAQCLECCMWQRIEVRLCTDLACPLYAVRPYQRGSQNGREGRLIRTGSKNLPKGDNNARQG